MQESDNILFAFCSGAAVLAALLACALVGALLMFAPAVAVEDSASDASGNAARAPGNREDGISSSSSSSALTQTGPDARSNPSSDVAKKKLKLSGFADMRILKNLSTAPTVHDAPEFSDKVEFYGQFPEVPGACEIASMVSVLRAMGNDIDAVRFTDEYVLAQPGDRDMVDGFGGDPYFAGGAFPPIMTRSGNAYLRQCESAWRFVERRGDSMEDLADVADRGRPVLIWTTMLLAPAAHTGMVTKGYEWYENEHCVVLCGRVGSDKYLVMDPLDGLVEYDAVRFTEAYEDSGSISVVLTTAMTPEIDAADEAYLVSFEQATNQSEPEEGEKHADSSEEKVENETA